MALFGDEDGDVGPFVMAEGGEEWFPFSLDNLEMDRACSSPQEDSRSMDQVRGDVCRCVCLSSLSLSLCVLWYCCCLSYFLSGRVWLSLFFSLSLSSPLLFSN